MTSDIYQNGPATSNQFLRKWSVSLLGANGASWTVSDSEASGAQSGGTTTIYDPLRVTFTTRQTMVQTPGNADITIWNLSLSNKINGLRKLYNRVVLRAGYQTGNFATIFQGTIINLEVGRSPDMVETYLKLLVSMGDFPNNLANVNTSLAAGGAISGAVAQIVKPMTDLGAPPSKVIGLSTDPFIRGVVHFGDSSNELMKYGQPFISDAGNATYVSKITDNFTVGNSGPIAINASTGLIGLAKITGDNGLEFDCLLNPLLAPRSSVQINNASVNQASGTGSSDIPGTTTQYGPGQQQIGYQIDTSADGTYVALVVEHHGDTRGNDWFTHVRAWPTGTPFNPAAAANFTQFPAAAPTTGQYVTEKETPNLPADPALATPNGPAGAPNLVPGGALQSPPNPTQQ